MNWFEAMSKKPIKAGEKIKIQETREKGKSVKKKSPKTGTH